jgi:hypothetical protein
MNIKSLTLTIISLTAATVAVSQPVLADDEEREAAKEGGMRWHFPKSTYRIETNPMPARSNDSPAAAVRSGAVPTQNSLIPSNMLAKAPPPMPMPNFAPPVMTQPAVSAKMFGTAPKIIPPQQAQIPAAFKAAFGKPLAVTTPVVASVPTPAQAPAMTARPSAPLKSIPVRRTVASNLSGRLLNPHKSTPIGRAATQLPAITSYGSNQAYTPGSFSLAPGSGSSTSTAVNGVLLHH